MDQITYDPRFHQYPNQTAGAYWYYTNPQQIAHVQDAPNFPAQHGSEPPGNYQYVQAPPHVPRQINSGAWMSPVPDMSQQAFGPIQNNHHYAHQVSRQPLPATTGYASQAPVQSSATFSQQAPSSIISYPAGVHQVIYYPGNIQQGISSYTRHPNTSTAQYANSTVSPSPTTAGEQYMHTISAHNGHGNWQYSEPEGFSRPVTSAGTLPPQSQQALTYAPLVRPATSGIDSPSCGRQIPTTSNPSFATLPTITKVEADESSLRQQYYARSNANPEIYRLRPSTADSRTSSSTVSPASTTASPFMVPIKRGDSPETPTPKTLVRKPSTPSSKKKDGLGDKKVGKRTGPLPPEKRKQAGEIRKCKACLRCKFLKKTCDVGNPCSGCRPHHARLWQVPCTRMSIQDVGYFEQDFVKYMDKRIDLEDITKDIMGEYDVPIGIWVSHGFGKAIQVQTHQFWVKDSKSYQVQWTEERHSSKPKYFTAPTAMLKPLDESISEDVMSSYVDSHIDGDGGFERFVDQLFDGTKFITEMLKTVYRYYETTKLPIVRQALKLMVAYNLTTVITIAETLPEGAQWDGQVEDPDSNNFGRRVAPRMVNFKIKKALTSLWRGLMKEVLNELASLYTGVYTGNKLKHWPTIFMLDTVLLAVWEEMQFDYHYQAERVDDSEAPRRFCHDMEGIPVGVIVGLFLAISQKMPTFLEWDNTKHHHVLQNDIPACSAMTEVRKHVEKHGKFESCLFWLT